MSFFDVEPRQLSGLQQHFSAGLDVKEARFSENEMRLKRDLTLTGHTAIHREISAIFSLMKRF